MTQERSQKGHAELDTADFDEAYDVIVAGYGFAGGIAAIEASRQGAKVLICEKMPQPGGISICSGGAVRCAGNADDAFAYLQATNSGTTPDAVLRALAEGMAGAQSYLEWLVAMVPGAHLKAMAEKKGGNYPFPGWPTFYSAQVEAPPGTDLAALYPNVRTKPSSGAPSMFYVIHAHLKRLGVDVRVGTAVARLIRTARNEIRGVVAATPRGERRIAARRAVILACGGFEANAQMKARYWE